MSNILKLLKAAINDMFDLLTTMIAASFYDGKIE